MGLPSMVSVGEPLMTGPLLELMSHTTRMELDSMLNLPSTFQQALALGPS